MITLITGILLGFLISAVLVLSSLVYVLLFVVYNNSNISDLDISFLNKFFRTKTKSKK